MLPFAPILFKKELIIRFLRGLFKYIGILKYLNLLGNIYKNVTMSFKNGVNAKKIETFIQYIIFIIVLLVQV